MAPMGCSHVIPGHVTGLYVFAVINLILLLNITFADANVLVMDHTNRTIARLDSAEADFGPALEGDGMWGHMVLSRPTDDGCKTIDEPPTPEDPWIALIKRGDCDFDIKVFNAQKAGYVGAIIFNNQSNYIFQMARGSKGKEVTIPSVMIGIDDAEYLAMNFDRNKKYSLLLDNKVPFDFEDYLIPFLAMCCLCIIGMAIFWIGRCVMDIHRKRRSRLSKTNLKKIPIKKFKKGDDYDVCAICIDEYEEGDKMRILPCSHAYHQKCIDPWLTKSKKTCPICKRKVIPSKKGEAGSDSSDSSDDEQRPLLPAQDLRTNPSRGGTFDNAGLPASMRAHVLNINDISDSEDSSDEHASSSVQQSSVEVHQNSHLHRGTPPTTASILDETDAASEAASSVGIFGGNTTETDDDMAAALLDPEAPVDTGNSNLAMEMSEDHFEPEDADNQPDEVQVIVGSGRSESDRHGDEKV